jgi:hypothetical protein
VLVRTGRSAALAGDEKMTPEKATPVKLKHLSEQPARDAQSYADFSVLLPGAMWWRWSQSGIAFVTDISAAVRAPAAMPTVAGGVATDKAKRTATMVRPMRRIMTYLIQGWLPHSFYSNSDKSAGL